MPFVVEAFAISSSCAGVPLLNVNKTIMNTGTSNNKKGDILVNFCMILIFSSVYFVFRANYAPFDETNRIIKSGS